MATTHGIDFALRLQQQPLAVHARQHRPAHGEDLVVVRLRDQRRRLRAADVFQVGERHALVDDAEDLLQPLAVGLDRLRVRFRRGEVRLPVLLALLDGRGQLAHQVLVDARDHLGGEVALLGERLGVGQRLGRGSGERQGEQRGDVKRAAWHDRPRLVVLELPIRRDGYSNRFRHDFIRNAKQFRQMTCIAFCRMLPYSSCLALALK